MITDAILNLLMQAIDAVLALLPAWAPPAVSLSMLSTLLGWISTINYPTGLGLGLALVVGWVAWEVGVWVYKFVRWCVEIASEIIPTLG